MLLFSHQTSQFTANGYHSTPNTHRTGVHIYMITCTLHIRIRPSPRARGPLDLVTYARSAVHSNPSAARRGRTLTLLDTSIPRPTRAAANSCVAACHSRADPSAAGENPDRVGGRSGPSGKQRESIAVCALPLLNLSSEVVLVAPPSDRPVRSVLSTSRFAAPLRRLVS